MGILLLRQAKGFPRLVWLVDTQSAAAWTQDGCSVSSKQGARSSHMGPTFHWEFQPRVELMLCPHLPITATRAALPASVLGSVPPVVGAS